MSFRIKARQFKANFDIHRKPTCVNASKIHANYLVSLIEHLIKSLTAINQYTVLQQAIERNTRCDN